MTIEEVLYMTLSKDAAMLLIAWFYFAKLASKENAVFLESRWTYSLCKNDGVGESETRTQPISHGL